MRKLPYVEKSILLGCSSLIDVTFLFNAEWKRCSVELTIIDDANRDGIICHEQ